MKQRNICGRDTLKNSKQKNIVKVVFHINYHNQNTETPWDVVHLAL